MEMETRIFTVIAGDLVRSRASANRQQLAHKIRLVLGQLSEEFQQEFYAPLILTRGIDELSGVLRQVTMSYRICRFLNERLHPHQFRFAVVRGALDIAIDSRDASKMDGPAFHTAADMIKQAKKENRYYCFKLGFPFPEFDLWLTELTTLQHLLGSSWSEHQRRVVHLYEKFGSQKEVAKKLGITQQTISCILKHANWNDWKRVENVVDETLAKYGSHK